MLRFPQSPQGTVVSRPDSLLSRGFLSVLEPRRVFKSDLKEDNEGFHEFLQEVYSSMKGSMGENREVFAMLIRQRY